MNKAYTIISCDEDPGYRYRLDVDTGKGSDTALVIQLNPSRADAKRSDPTIGKVSFWAAENEISKVIFVNLFARRSTDPNELRGKSLPEIVGSRNDTVFTAALAEADIVICAWGKIHHAIEPLYRLRLATLGGILNGQVVHGVGSETVGGFPRHGRMWNAEHRTLRALDWHSL